MERWQVLVELARLIAFAGGAWLLWGAVRWLGRRPATDELIDGLIQQKGWRPCGPADAPWTTVDYDARERTKHKRLAEEAAVRKARQNATNPIILPHEVREFKRKEA
jgi:hypothetical protein